MVIVGIYIYTAGFMMVYEQTYRWGRTTCLEIYIKRPDHVFLLRYGPYAGLHLPFWGISWLATYPVGLPLLKILYIPNIKCISICILWNVYIYINIYVSLCRRLFDPQNFYSHYNDTYTRSGPMVIILFITPSNWILYPINPTALVVN